MQVEIWSDVVCPWCAVGKARFEQALDVFAHRAAVTLRWRSFELDPSAPAAVEGPYVERLAAKYGTSVAGAQTMLDQMVAQGAAEGLEFRFDIARPGNTFDAHRLLHLAADRGLQHQVKDRFLAAYHSQGAAIGEHAALQRQATEAGLDEVEVKQVLAGDAYADAVRADERQAAVYGIRGVPFFVLDGRLGVSGAQPADVLRNALQQAWDTRAPLTVLGTDGPRDHGHAHDADCADGSCAV